MLEIWTLVLVAVLLISLGVVFFGAPYLPTRKKDVDKIFKLLNLPKGAMIVDLGSGDGRVIIKAAQAGYKSIGYELNPFLVALTWLRLRPYKNSKVQLKNYWQIQLPPETAAVFVFLATSYMPRLKKYLESHVNRTRKPILLVSYGFELPGYQPISKNKALLVYRITPLQA